MHLTNFWLNLSCEEIEYFDNYGHVWPKWVVKWSKIQYKIVWICCDSERIINNYDTRWGNKGKSTSNYWVVWDKIENERDRKVSKTY